MNKTVNLAKTPFYLGEYLVLPDQLLLQAQGSSTKLDSKIMSLLIYFAENPGQVISRDQLIEHVWQGNIVSESSINWAISQMRKMLGDSASQAKYLKTISKKGYQLTATVSIKSETVIETPLNIPTEKPSKVTNKTYLVWALTILVLLSSLGLYLRHTDANKIEYDFASATLITSLSGQEDDGRLSPDGSQLLFRHKALDKLNWQLFIQPLTDNRKFAEYSDKGEKTGRLLSSRRVLSSLPLLQDSYNYLTAEWAPDGKSIAVVRKNINQCQMVMLRLDAKYSIVQQQVFNQCNNKGWSKLVWHPNGQRLFFTDQIQQTDTYQVFEYSIASGEISSLTMPEKNGLGDKFIDIDSKGEKLLVLRDINGIKTQFMSLNLNDNLLTELAMVESHYYSAYWGLKQDIWLNWGNKNVISYDPKDKVSTALFSSTLNWNYNTKPYLEFNKAIFTSSSANRSDILVLEADNQWQPQIIQSDYNESLPTLNKSGNLAFISDRSGIPQIWLGETQLSDTSEYGEFESLKWSHDDQHILGIRKGYLASINLEKESLRMHYSGDLHPNNANWSLDDKTIYFTAKSNKKWRLFNIAADSKNQEVTQIADIDIYNAHPFSNAEILFTKPEQQGLWSLDKKTHKARLLLPNFPWKNKWQVVGDAVYYLNKQDGLNSFKRFELTSKKITTLASIKQNIQQQFAVTKDGSKIIAVAYVVEESAIYQIPFSLRDH